MAGLMKIDSFRSPYAERGEVYEELMKRISGMTAIDAIIEVLHQKRSKQADKIDANMYALVAKTGTGKSTTLVYYLYRAFLANRGRRGTLLCTQPMVGLAVGVAEALPTLFPGLTIGWNIGYHTGKRRRIPSESTRIIYLTTMELVNYMSRQDPEKFSKEYPIVIIDEAHDQSLEMLLVVNRIRSFMVENPSINTIFIFASATIHPPDFIKYLGGDPLSPYNTGFVEGATKFPIEERYLTEPVEGDIVENAARLTKTHFDEIGSKMRGEVGDTKSGKPDGSSSSIGATESSTIVRERPSHVDILAIFESKRSIARYIKRCKELIPTADGGVKPLFLTYDRTDAPSNSKNYREIFRGPHQNEIRIIGSTPAIQVGATIPTLAVVIDSGKILGQVPFPLLHREEIMVRPISDDTRIQRFGRVGRTGPGLAIGAYPESAKKALRPVDMPNTLLNASVPSKLLNMVVAKTMDKYELSSDDILSILKLLALSRTPFPFPTMDLVNDVDLMYPISMDMYMRAMGRLTTLGLLSKRGTLMPVGIQASALQCSSGIAGTYLKARIGDLHPFDVELLLDMCKPRRQRAEVTGIIDWAPVMM